MKKFYLIVMSLFILVLAACGNAAADDKVVTLAVYDDPVFKEIADIAVEKAKDEGYKLELKNVTDLVTPNSMVDQGEVDGNFFQHYAFMGQYNEGNDANLIGALEVFVDPAGLYSSNLKSLDELPDGGKVSIPNDPANNGRALFMLQKEGLLKLKEGVSVTDAKVSDIVENPKNLSFVEVEQQMLGRTIKDVDLGFMFTAIAVSNGLNPKDALIIETEEDDIEPFTIVITTKEEAKDSEKVEVLKKAFQNDEVYKVLKENFPLVVTSWHK